MAGTIHAVTGHRWTARIKLNENSKEREKECQRLKSTLRRIRCLPLPK